MLSICKFLSFDRGEALSVHALLESLRFDYDYETGTAQGEGPRGEGGGGGRRERALAPTFKKYKLKIFQHLLFVLVFNEKKNNNKGCQVE